ncbi:MAG: hypothetical protein QOJ35_2214, partial [Solirubrobacteraceae bacterium]|nr:hypothetical protein [Solirubrobacteraceae bacterium]
MRALRPVALAVALAIAGPAAWAGAAPAKPRVARHAATRGAAIGCDTARRAARPARSERASRPARPARPARAARAARAARSRQARARARTRRCATDRQQRKVL